MNTIHIRPACGSYKEAMARAARVEPSAQAIRGHLGAEEGEVVLAPYGYDQRNGWDTYLILIDGAPWGFADGPATLTE